MRRFYITATLAVILTATLVFTACGGENTDGGHSTAPPETTAQAASTTAAPTTEASTGDESWKTVVTLTSDATPWQDMPGLLVSDPFAVKGKVRVVLDMPDAGELDGVLLAIIPADQLGDPITLIDAIRDGTALTLIPAYPEKEVDGLDGTYVLLNSVPTETPWTVELQTP
ncbi:MAG: hypothetical protein JW990_14410 [Thermoleophilia bacterium]|nr:hypothetical protein [Thermoleophilia bacterium]